MNVLLLCMIAYPYTNMWSLQVLLLLDQCALIGLLLLKFAGFLSNLSLNPLPSDDFSDHGLMTLQPQNSNFLTDGTIGPNLSFYRTLV